MSIKMGIAVAAGLCAMIGLTGGAGAEMAAPSKAPKPKTILLIGCATKGIPEFCVMIQGGGPKAQNYNVTGANPAVPVGKPVRLRGEVTNKLSPCGGIVLDNVKWMSMWPAKCRKPAGAK
jgi:hypothetical protein